jgi:hypothetical protein
MRKYKNKREVYMNTSYEWEKYTSKNTFKLQTGETQKYKKQGKIKKQKKRTKKEEEF